MQTTVIQQKRTVTGEGLDTASAVSGSMHRDDSLNPDRAVSAMNITINPDSSMHNQSMELMKTVDAADVDETYGLATTGKKKVKLNTSVSNIKQGSRHEKLVEKA